MVCSWRSEREELKAEMKGIRDGKLDLSQHLGGHRI